MYRGPSTKIVIASNYLKSLSLNNLCEHDTNVLCYFVNYATMILQGCPALTYPWNRLSAGQEGIVVSLCRYKQRCRKETKQMLKKSDKFGCDWCETYKSLEEFSINMTTGKRTSSKCIKCTQQDILEWKIANPSWHPGCKSRLDFKHSENCTKTARKNSPITTNHGFIAPTKKGN